jgi:hypothetical protein
MEKEVSGTGRKEKDGSSGLLSQWGPSSVYFRVGGPPEEDSPGEKKDAAGLDGTHPAAIS